MHFNNLRHSTLNRGLQLLPFLLASVLAIALGSRRAYAQSGSSGATSVLVRIAGAGEWGSPPDDNTDPSIEYTLTDINGTHTVVADGIGYDAVVEARWIPGKTYTLTVQGNYMAKIITAVSAPPGYRVFIDNTEEHIISRNFNYTAVDYYYPKITILPESDGIPAHAGSGGSFELGAKIVWRTGMGATRPGSSAGSLGIISDGAGDWSELANPGSLVVADSTADNIIWTAAGGQASGLQIAAFQTFVDIVPDSGGSYYWINFYNLAQVPFPATGTDINGGFPYACTGAPYSQFKIERVGSTTHLKITNYARDDRALSSATAPVVRTMVTEIQKDSTGVWTIDDWHELGGTADVLATVSLESVTNQRTETIIRKNAAGVVAAKTKKIFHTYTWGEELIQEITDPDGAALTTTYDYYPGDLSSDPNYAGIKSKTFPDGSWQAFDYGSSADNTFAVVSHTYEPWGDSPTAISTSATSGKVTTFKYITDMASSELGRPASNQTVVNGTTAAHTTISYATAMANNTTIVIATNTDFSSSANSTATITKFYREGSWFAPGADNVFPGLTYSLQRPNGTKDSYAYETGTWNSATKTFTPDADQNLGPYHLEGNVPVSPSADTRTIVFHGSSRIADGDSFSVLPDLSNLKVDQIYLVPSKSTEEVTVRDSSGNTVRSEVYAYMGSNTFVLIGSADYTYNIAGRLVGKASNNGASYSASYTGDFKTSETTEQGVTTTYVPDSQNRVHTATEAGATGVVGDLTTQYGYDAAGHTISQVTGPLGSNQLSVSWTYNLAGQLTKQVAPGGYTTNYTYNGLITTTQFPSLATKIEERYLDGHLKSVTGTAVVSEFHTFDVQPDGTQHFVTKIGKEDSSRLSERWSDWLGRTVKTSRPGFSGTSQPAIVQQMEYFTNTGPRPGMLKKITQSADDNSISPDTYFVYDELARVKRKGWAIADTSPLTLASKDRITDIDQLFTKDTNGVYWSTTKTTVYPVEDDATPLVVQQSSARLTGLVGTLRGEIVSSDVNGNVTTTKVAQAGGTVTTTKTSSIVTATASATTVNGLKTSDTGFDGVVHTTTYDVLRRVLTEGDSRKGSSTMAYYPNSLNVNTVTDAASVIIDTYTYDTAGHVSSEKNAQGKMSYTDYNKRGQALHHWGNVPNPVEYIYDDTYGEQKELHTFQSETPGWTTSTWPTSPTPSSVTKWSYDEPTGLLASKTDAADHAVTYEYNNRGQRSARKSARLVSGTTRLTASYEYEITGDLKAITYNDSAGANPTPSVNYTYTRTGQIYTVDDGVTGTRTFEYNAATDSNWLQLDAIDLDSFYGSKIQNLKYDAYHRSNGFAIGTADISQTVAYDGVTGRYDHIDSRRAGQTNAHTFTYTYVANSDLVANLTGSGDSIQLKVDYAYETTRDLLASVDSQWGETSRTRYDYTHNSLYQPETSVQSGSVYNDYGASSTFRIFQYDDRGELKTDAGFLGSDPTSQNSPLPSRRFEYTYDAIGNRTTSNHTGVAGTKNNYSFDDVNYPDDRKMNRYSSRDNAVLQVSGTVTYGATVLVSGRPQNAAVKGGFWTDDFTVANLSGPYSQAVIAAATKSGSSTTTGGKTAYVPPFTQTYTYDLDGNMLSDGIWTYLWDAENRLIKMTTIAAAATAGYPNRIVSFKYDYLGHRVQKRVQDAGTSAEISCRRYLYDGWKLIAEFDATGETCGSILRSFTWGLDLAGGSGIGSLLQIADHATGAYYLPTFDENGNVMSLLSASDGSVAAAYEYSPFGELLRKEGPYAAANPFRFSTMFTDEETGLIYYGTRYYDSHSGRFISKDSIEEAGGPNLYGFCGNDAVGHYDVLGRVTPSLKPVNEVPIDVPTFTVNDVPVDQPTAMVAAGFYTPNGFGPQFLGAKFNPNFIQNSVVNSRQIVDRLARDKSPTSVKLINGLKTGQMSLAVANAIIEIADKTGLSISTAFQIYYQGVYGGGSAQVMSIWSDRLDAWVPLGKHGWGTPTIVDRKLYYDEQWLENQQKLFQISGLALNSAMIAVSMNPELALVQITLLGRLGTSARSFVMTAGEVMAEGQGYAVAPALTETQLEFAFARGAAVQTPGMTLEGETFIRVGARPVNLKFGATEGGAQPGTYAFPEATFNAIGEDPALLKDLGDLPDPRLPQYYRTLRPPAGTAIQRGVVPGGENGGIGGAEEVVFPDGF
jgi:RHS repeat-associated protein